MNVSQSRNFLQQSQCQKSPTILYCCPLNLKLPRAEDGICGRTFEKIDKLPNRIVGGEKVKRITKFKKNTSNFIFINPLNLFKQGNFRRISMGGNAQILKT